MPDIRRIVANIDAFDAACAKREHTDVQDAWDLLHQIRRDLVAEADLSPVDLSGTIGEVVVRLALRLRESGLLDEGEGLGVYAGLRNDGRASLPWPNEGKWPDAGWAKWIACYAVRGDSEGWYVHVDAVWQAEGADRPGRRVLLALGKEWSADRALQVANACARLLDAV